MKKGFTLIELLAVIVVLAIISVIAIPTLVGVVNKAKLNTLKSSAYGLIEAGTLYHAQYDNRVNARFDISNNNIATNETNKIKYKGYIKQGVVIVSTKGKVSVCVTDGKNSAYKNYDDSEVTLVKGKTCTVPANTSVVYLDGEATIDQVDAKAILDKLEELEAKSNNGIPTLNFASPLHTFDSSNTAGHGLSFTAPKDCYLFGNLPVGLINNSSNSVSLSINGTSVKKSSTLYHTSFGSFAYAGADVDYIKIKEGWTVSVSNSSPDLHAFEALNE